MNIVTKALQQHTVYYYKGGSNPSSWCSKFAAICNNVGQVITNNYCEHFHHLRSVVCKNVGQEDIIKSL